MLRMMLDFKKKINIKNSVFVLKDEDFHLILSFLYINFNFHVDVCE